jgi:hypothetical protein
MKPFLQSTILWIIPDCKTAVDVLSLVWRVRPQWAFYILIAVHLPPSFPALCPNYKCVSSCFYDYIHHIVHSVGTIPEKGHDHVLWEVGQGSFPGGTGARAWSWPLLCNQCQVKEKYSYTSTPTTWLHSIQRDNFTFYHLYHYARSLSTITDSPLPHQTKNIQRWFTYCSIS